MIMFFGNKIFWLIFHKSRHKLIKTQLLFVIINRRINEFISLQLIKKAF
jgi:hypothetical protein